MFFNISNHPAHIENSTWSALQIQEAEILGEGPVVDIPFPKIVPDMTDEQIAGIAREVARDIKGMCTGGDGAMVAGEYVTTIRIIAELQKVGVNCYFGQSERVAEERIENGKTVVVHKFIFAGFRRAPAIALI